MLFQAQIICIGNRFDGTIRVVCGFFVGSSCHTWIGPSDCTCVCHAFLFEGTLILDPAGRVLSDIYCASALCKGALFLGVMLYAVHPLFRCASS